MFDFFIAIYNSISTILYFILTLISSLYTLILSIPLYLEYATYSITFLPEPIILIGTITITIFAFLFFIGR